MFAILYLKGKRVRSFAFIKLVDDNRTKCDLFDDHLLWPALGPLRYPSSRRFSIVLRELVRTPDLPKEVPFPGIHHAPWLSDRL